MTLMMPDGVQDVQPQLTRGLSGIFRRKSKGTGGGHSVFEAEGDALDAFGASAVAAIPAGAGAGASPVAGPGQLVVTGRPGSGRASGRGWGILSRKSSSGAAEAACQQQQAQMLQLAAAQQAEEEVAALRARCRSQGQELVAMSAQLAAAQAAERAAQERLNLQKFKFELLVDLWAVRVLDNEELGAQHSQQAGPGM